MILQEYIKIVEKSRRRINEGGQGAKVYNDMFKDYLADPKLAPKAQQYISWAVKNLKKQDRIIWFLRWARVDLAANFGKEKPKGTASQQVFKDELAKLNKRFGTSHYYAPNMKELQTKLQHFLSLPIYDIQETKWSTQSPDQLIAEFREMEQEWQEASSERNQIDYDEGDEPTKILEFPDGYAWFDLEQSHCSREAAAMGHCGNGAAKDGTIFSLRKLVSNTDGKTVWYPVLTFISHDGVLGEMKGRNNDKPVEKYHPYIIALLESDYVTEIKGGGYMPEHNFKLTDLEPEERDRLLKLKPDLAELDYFYQKEGMTDRVLRRLDTALDSADLPGYRTYDKENKRFIVAQWRDFESFIRDIYDENIQNILKIALGEEDYQLSPDANIQNVFADTIIMLPEEWQRKIIMRSGLPHPQWADMDDLCRQAARRLMHSDDEYFRLFQHAMQSDDRLKQEAWERLLRYVKAGFGYSSFYVYDNVPDNSVEELKHFVTQEDTVNLYLSEQDMINYATADQEDSDGYDAWSLRGDGDAAAWEMTTFDNLHDRRQEEGLTTGRNGKDEWLEGGTETESIEDEFLKALRSGTLSAKIDDPNQQEMEFQESLRRMLDMAGIKQVAEPVKQKIRL